MLHHISFAVADLKRAGAFYDRALSSLGYRRVFEDASAIGYGVEDGKDKFCLKLRPDVNSPGPGFHLAFAAPTRDAVDAFYAAAVATGGICNGPPGARPNYGPTYYAAFVIDPDGYRVEAVINAA